jgi:hypothetical protein
VKTPSVAAKTQSISRPKGRSVESYDTNEAEEEPPGKCAIIIKPEDKPPGTTAVSGYRSLRDVPESLWRDWKWHFRHRITSINQLGQFIPLSSVEKGDLQLVTRRYPLSITPYYLSLINPDDPDDPIRKQAVPS